MYVLPVVNSLFGDMLWFWSVQMWGDGRCYCRVFLHCVFVYLWCGWVSIPSA